MLRTTLACFSVHYRSWKFSFLVSENQGKVREFDIWLRVGTLVKPSAPFITGSIAYTKSLFRLVKCTILCLGCWLVSGCSLGWKSWWFQGFGLAIIVLPGLKSDEFQRCPDSMVIGSFFPGRKWKRAKKEICWDPRSFGWMESQGRKAWRKT